MAYLGCSSSCFNEKGGGSRGRGLSQCSLNLRQTTPQAPIIAIGPLELAPQFFTLFSRDHFPRLLLQIPNLLLQRIFIFLPFRPRAIVLPSQNFPLRPCPLHFVLQSPFHRLHRASMRFRILSCLVSLLSGSFQHSFEGDTLDCELLGVECELSLECIP